ncbi:hypothetical protein B0H17DRAFT_1151674 [Mycena rosella]|uniref:Uncharacterized protein n=1 Tax=Mycena rosella TaxID=1033263 RepID=A0AAD7BJI9_MYCRO|nr:hypothetical protein B0H17DRAFT_1151674 [Mycena rosella]
MIGRIHLEFEYSLIKEAGLEGMDDALAVMGRKTGRPLARREGKNENDRLLPASFCHPTNLSVPRKLTYNRVQSQTCIGRWRSPRLHLVIHPTAGGRSTRGLEPGFHYIFSPLISILPTSKISRGARIPMKSLQVGMLVVWAATASLNHKGPRHRLRIPRRDDRPNLNTAREKSSRGGVRTQQRVGAPIEVLEKFGARTEEYEPIGAVRINRKGSVRIKKKGSSQDEEGQIVCEQGRKGLWRGRMGGPEEHKLGVMHDLLEVHRGAGEVQASASAIRYRSEELEKARRLSDSDTGRMQHNRAHKRSLVVQPGKCLESGGAAHGGGAAKGGMIAVAGARANWWQRGAALLRRKRRAAAAATKMGGNAPSRREKGVLSTFVILQCLGKSGRRSMACLVGGVRQAKGVLWMRQGRVVPKKKVGAQTSGTTRVARTLVNDENDEGWAGR